MYPSSEKIAIDANEIVKKQYEELTLYLADDQIEGEYFCNTHPSTQFSSIGIRIHRLQDGCENKV
jgi:hypothetical protein